MFAEELRAIDARLDELAREREILLARRSILLDADLGTLHLSASQKIDIYMALFRGRQDIYANRWQNQQGRSGYSVSCHNEWQQDKCHKPKIKCTECVNQAFKLLDRQAIYDHLSGRQTLGLYPLLEDNRCWLLAADFDKSDWQEAVSAFRQACRELGVPFSVERSRSGNGAHIWVFFETPVSASAARQLGFILLDKAMEYHAGLSFESYDRLFPNQDVLPIGGFGNLIALPLQNVPRQQGNSVFIDDFFAPYVDQWAYLASTKKLTDIQLNIILDGKQGVKPDANRVPWLRNFVKSTEVVAGCPQRLTLVVANRLYIRIDALPLALLAKLKRIASFSNPVFFRTQALRFSTNGIPRFICLAEVENDYLALPRGCFDEVSSLLKDHSIEIELEDKRQQGTILKGLVFNGELRKNQKTAVEVLAKHDIGILHAPTAFGKTVAAIGLIHRRKVNTLVLVHSRQLLDQWKERLAVFLTDCEVGLMGGGKRKFTGQIDIATYQSLISRKDNSVDPIIYDYGHVIIDECHHISAPNYERLLHEVHAKYVLGITATPHRQDGHQPIIFMQAGPIRHVVANQGNNFVQQVRLSKLQFEVPSELTGAGSRPHIADVYRWLANNEQRNDIIVDDIFAAITQQRHPIVLTERREHAELLGHLLSKRGIHVLLLRGAMGTKERKLAMGMLNSAQVIVATGKYIGEGFDLPKLDTLFLVMPISWKGSLVQYVGRIQRQFEGKDRVIVFDYLDTSLPMLCRMYQKRAKGYAAMGYQILDKHAELPQNNLCLDL
ncbi:TOTE conflict system archaeo-eukaryotic primase domain-containing protein [Shewanella sp. SW24]|uniref:TOTE conflict system archaeo-eukaryotic primase domain-containing protein n=1 Tax=Shewanella TaxID=22 RepID=UPI0021DB63E2|nr:DEAD/DEAH box helicase [Shewanella sp. SW24]MCU7986547.1 DEAD/DEAH box helicase [Shewanella sp. SW24]